MLRTSDLECDQTRALELEVAVASAVRTHGLRGLSAPPQAG
jgi:hypothetical protein